MPRLFFPNPPKFKPGPGASLNFGHPQAFGLVGMWLFNEGGGLRVRGEINPVVGTLTDPLWQGGNPHLAGNALFFNGTTTEGVIPTHPQVNLTGPMSVAFWFYNTGAIAGRVVIRKGDIATNNAGWVVSQSGTSNTVSFGRGFSSINVQRSFQPDNGVITAGWHHVVMVHTGGINASTLSCYIDGINAAITSTTNGSGTLGDDSADDIALGKNAAGTTFFDGGLDHFRIYNRALNQPEAQALFVNPFADFVPQVSVARRIIAASSSAPVTVDQWFQPMAQPQRRSRQPQPIYQMAYLPTAPIDTQFVRVFIRLVNSGLR